jgi:hypothetical protein
MTFSTQWSCKWTLWWIALLWYTMLLNRLVWACTSAQCRTVLARRAQSGPWDSIFFTVTQRIS